jgi:hypothetical protein
MQQLLHLFYRFNRGPHGNAVAAVLIGSFLLFGALLAGAAYEPLRAPVMAIALTAVFVVLNLSIVLLNLLRAKINDTHYAISLEAGLRRAGYDPVDFFTDGAAANPSLQLLHLKVLQFCRPQRVLELGSGQTTKLLSCYARENHSAYVLSLEQDESWLQRLKEHVVHDYRHVPLQPTEFTCSGSKLHLKTMWYQSLPELRDGHFDYLLVDGPDPGTPGTAHNEYSRSGILEYVPAILSPSFVVVFDDAERYGEIMTMRAFEDILRARGIQYVRFAVHGIKTQVVFCSRDRSYLRSV